MFDDFFYHKPVTGTTGTNLDGITRATQVSVGSFQVRNSGEQKFRWSKWNAKDFFSVGWFGWWIFFPKIVKLRLVWSFFRSFRFWFWMILDEFNLMIETLKRRKLGINIASGTILTFCQNTPLVQRFRWDFSCRNRGEPGGFARRTPLWIWTLDLEKPWLLWWAPWWWNSWNSSLLEISFCWPASWHFQCN